ncbi:MAG: acetoacetate decarboxylase family protein [Lachnospiraceae bacterium]
MASFNTKQEDLKGLFNVPHIDQQEGVYFTYATDADVLRSLVPQQLHIVAPVVVGYLVNIEKPNFGDRYMEFALGVPCAFDEQTIGLYPFCLLLEGPGAFDGTTLGREFDGLPKKYAEELSFSKNGNTITATVVRKGTKLMDLKVELGAYNNQMAADLFAPEGSTTQGNTFLYTYNTMQAEDGSCGFSNGRLNNLIMETKNRQWTPGNLELAMYSSENDPYGELPILQPLGGAYIKHDTVIMQSLRKLMDVDANEIAQYQAAGRYDLCQYTK